MGSCEFRNKSSVRVSLWDTYRPLSMRGTWNDSTACFCRITNRIGLSKPRDNTSTVTRTPSVYNQENEENTYPVMPHDSWMSRWEHRTISVTLETHLVPGDGVIESIDGLIRTCNRVIVGDIELGVFLDHIFGLPHRPNSTDKLGHAQPEQDSETWSDPARRSSTAVFMSRFPATPEHHDVWQSTPIMPTKTWRY